jgi:hypothetical protein
MVFKIFQEILKQEGTIKEKIKRIQELKKYYGNLKREISSGKIFHNEENQNQEIVKLISRFSDDDFLLLDNLFKKDVKDFLLNKNLKKYLDFQKRNCSNQIGINTIFVEKPITGLWTTGKATFFIPTICNKENELIIEFQSIAPMKIFIGIEEKILCSVNISKLSTKKINIKIPQENIKDNISEIFIYTDKLWMPHIIFEIKKEVVLGIGIKTIRIRN